MDPGRAGASSARRVPPHEVDAGWDGSACTCGQRVVTSSPQLCYYSTATCLSALVSWATRVRSLECCWDTGVVCMDFRQAEELVICVYGETVAFLYG